MQKTDKYFTIVLLCLVASLFLNIFLATLAHKTLGTVEIFDTRYNECVEKYNDLVEIPGLPQGNPITDGDIKIEGLEWTSKQSNT